MVYDFLIGLGADQTVSALVALLVAADAVSGLWRFEPTITVDFGEFMHAAMCSHSSDIALQELDVLAGIPTPELSLLASRRSVTASLGLGVLSMIFSLLYDS